MTDSDAKEVASEIVGEPRRFCRKCLLRDMENTGGVDLAKYLSAIKDSDKASPTLYEERLLVCKECEFLSDATCVKCGCYVEFRAVLKDARCPGKRWHIAKS